MAPVDRLTPLLERFRVRTRLFHTGPLCGVTTFAARPGRGFLHVLRHGEMDVTYQGTGGRLERTRIDRPSLLFYPRPLEHAFHNAPTADSDFACATLDFDGGQTHPLVRTLPPVIVLPLHVVDSLGPALDLLFAEIDNVRCGNPVLADRLFEVVLIQLFRWILDHTTELALPAGLLRGLSDDRLARTLVAIHESPGRPWTLTTMAREANLSRSTFAARFKATVGQPPADYLTAWRLTVAQDRLRHGATVSATAAELGYANSSAFSRVFTQRLGRSPRAWRATADR
ncbi:AraC family transcriptional regulator [Stackebrandtia nassauensis]|uniref:Transcriptional regulator, AraC family n=1 Tax=Stackebrandtia nassauensis (strain DSM 44728 / CIP 108903 / NRRL B-16338 / NBRC 102104 / LLR-40K-21) TaxID=446470 RepID=D3Q3D5_STANL|nr:AraC family transcriptional regulator [Stackebrandtia nassauensis]ADD41976.1 transcriptional regulator, AraC family [Stackebrandtia nassauensis DSM 44728]